MAREHLSRQDLETRRKPAHTIALFGRESIVAAASSLVNPPPFAPVIPVGMPRERTPDKFIGVKAIPYVGGSVHADWRRLNFSTEVGIGVHFPESGRQIFWGLDEPHFAIHSWRAMKLLEEAQRIENNTLARAWSAAQRRIHPVDRDSVARFAKDVGEERFPLIRQSVLAQVPTADELVVLIGKLSFAGIPADYREYQLEMQTGGMSPEPAVIEAYEQNRGMVSLYKQAEAAIRSRTPRL